MIERRTVWSLARRMLLTLLAISMPILAPAADDEGFVSLFNGKDLSGWEGDSVHWSVQDGAITGKTTPETLIKSNTFLVWQGGKPADFVLRLKFKMQGGNSGVQYRSKLLDPEKYIVGGYQADIDSTGELPLYNPDVYAEALESGRVPQVGATNAAVSK